MAKNKIYKEYEDLSSEEKVIYYNAICGCGSTDCNMDIKLSKEHNLIILDAHTDFFTDYVKKFSKRLRMATKILLGKRISISADFIFNNEEQINDFVEALQEGVKKLKRK